MKTLTSSATIVSSPFYLPIFSPKSKDPSSIGRRILRFSISPKNNDNQSELRSNSNDSCLVPILSNRTLSKDAVMGLVLSAANVRGWTTDSGMEGPPVPAGSESESSTEKISTFPCSLFTKSPRRRMRVAFTCNVCGQGTTRAINPHVYTEVPAGSESESSTEKISTFPWSLFTKSPRRRMRVAFTCNVCGQRTTRAINPHAYTDGTVFVQCCGCNVFHKLVDNLLPERLSISNMLPSSLPVEALHKSAIYVNSGDCQRRFPCNYMVYQLGGRCRSWFGPIWCC